MRYKPWYALIDDKTGENGQRISDNKILSMKLIILKELNVNYKYCNKILELFYKSLLQKKKINKYLEI